MFMSNGGSARDSPDIFYTNIISPSSCSFSRAHKPRFVKLTYINLTPSHARTLELVAFSIGSGESLFFERVPNGITILSVITSESNPFKYNVNPLVQGGLS